MNKIKIKKIAAAIVVGALFTAQVSVFAAPSTIGTGTVVGDPSFNTDIIWDGNFPGTASGTITGIKVNATIEPTISMELSAKEIDLGILAAWVTGSGTIDIEVGTNAVNGVTITVLSGSGGLANTSDNLIKINNTDADWESYKFSSNFNLKDSTITDFANSGDLTLVEINSNAPVTIYNTNRPEMSDGVNSDLTFRVEATANAQTPAGSYQDTLNFMITGNF